MSTIDDIGLPTDLMNAPSHPDWAQAVADAVAQAMNNISPVGTVYPFAGATPPTGWLVCQGQTVAAATYPELFAAIGTAYGGDTANFAIPNLKGRTLSGLDTGQVEFASAAKVGGAKTHTLTLAELPSHSHVQNTHNHTSPSHTHGYHGGTPDGNSFGFIGGGGAGWCITPGSGNNAIYRQVVSNTTSAQASVAASNNSTGSGGVHNNIQPYITVNFIIRAA